MTCVRAHIAISLDGFAAGPGQTLEDPLGQGGEELHTWMFGDVEPSDAAVIEEVSSGVGAYVMGRNMFAGPGEWDPQWRGWWGEDPPYHAPVFVLTHHPREPLEMQGGTTFHFVTDGFDAAFERAREAAGDRDVGIAGGASTVRQALRAGVLEVLWLHITPVLLHDGERLLADVGDTRLEQDAVVASSAVTHVRYRVAR